MIEQLEEDVVRLLFSIRSTGRQCAPEILLSWGGFQSNIVVRVARMHFVWMH